jgi:hypothetical protein
MRQPSEEEVADYRQEEAENRYERTQQRKLNNELDIQRRDPGYVPSWERE